MEQKRKSLKKVLMTEIIAFVVVIIVLITVLNVIMQTVKIKRLTSQILARESISYANDIYSWWNSIEDRVAQTAEVYKNTPAMSYDDTLNMLLSLTKSDPDSQDIYIAFGDDNKFLDGSGWIPDDTFVFTDRVWYKGALAKNGAIYTSEPYVDASTGKTCLACAIMLKNNVVLSSDIVFDKVAEKLNKFKSSSDEAKFYIINKDTKDILVSNVTEVVGQKLSDSTDGIIKGLNDIFDKLDTSTSIESDKVITASSPAGKMMYAATDIQDTSWVVVSAVPYSHVSSSIWNTIFSTSGIAIALLIVLAVVLLIVIAKYINPVTKVTAGITDISNGNFKVSLNPEGNNEITTLSESLNGYIGNMRQMLMSMATISKDMNTSAGDCYDISHNLLASNKSQGESVKMLDSTLNAMNSKIDEIDNAATQLANTSKQLAQNAEDVKKLCDATMESSKTGKDEMQNMTGNVEALNETINKLTTIIRTAAKSVEEITGITDTINSISQQTNLLSLNASIEAARAGEMGRGFAIVASEVGALAQQSSQSTDHIRKLIKEVTKNIAVMNEMADTCLEDMSACVTGVESSNKSFDAIYEDVAKANDGIERITVGINRINEVANGNAASTREQASRINEVLSLSEKIVSESNKIMSQTDSITQISESLNRYSDSINTDLSKYEL